MHILSGSRKPQTPVGMLSEAATPREKKLITTLGELSIASMPADTILIIGNSQSYVHEGMMITPRHYRQGVGY
jgi:precorrin-3B C17-methyltransferase